MARVPRDVDDLHLAPLLIALDARLNGLGLLDRHAWQLSWRERGIRVAHGLNSVVLGTPLGFQQ